jgi:hypothetical protein
LEAGTDEILKDIPGVRLCDYENPKLATG